MNDAKGLRLQEELDASAFRIRRFERERRPELVDEYVGPLQRVRCKSLFGGLRAGESSHQLYANHARLIAEKRAWARGEARNA